MAYILTEEGWQLGGLGQAPREDELTDADISGLINHVATKVLAFNINFEIVKLSLGDLIPDVLERIVVNVGSDLVAKQIQKRLELKEPAKASNIARALADDLVTGAMEGLGEVVDIDASWIMGLEVSALISEASLRTIGIGYTYNEVATSPLEEGQDALEIAGLDPFSAFRVGILVFGNPEMGKLLDMDIRSKLANIIKKAILEFAEQVGYEPPPEDLWSEGERKFFQMMEFGTQDPGLEWAETQYRRELAILEAKEELPILPIAAGIAAILLLM